MEILYGILIWQFVVFILVVIWDDDEKTIYGSCFVFSIICWAIGKIIKPIYKNYIKSHYNGYRFYLNKTSFTHGLTYMNMRTASKFNQDETKGYYIKMCSEGKTWKSIPSKHEIYKKGLLSGMDKETFEKFLK